ncbi:hypothetical protein L1I30_13335 [Gillisia sp. M10.2A]|uniref:Glycosyltransferase n=1 Tax=Gillisia lutea TaxID=2909668 RepID=A0ABS9EKG9_9FLAO|nr:hypothetical protein [Gillisia lutea]MCF4102654.1 hypothetical protein [Gillisia lutea]
MTIFYIIANLKKRNTGKGGSFHSAATIAKAMSNKHEVFFFVIGDFDSEAVAHILNNNYIYLDTSGFLGKIEALYLYIKYLFKYKPSITHVFGNNVLFLTYLAQVITKSRTIFTKCGKGNSGFSANHFHNIITISYENFDYLDQNKSKFSYPIKNLGYFPNRILPFDQDKYLIHSLKTLINYHPNDFIILRIGRLNSYYQEGIIASINFFKNNYDNNSNVKLLLVGHRDESLDLTKYEGIKNVFIIDTPEFTKNPKTILSIADIKITNGRTTMEACYTGGNIAIPTKKHGLVRLSKDNWQEMLHYNFSERVELSEKLLISEVYDENFPMEIFHDNFNANSIVDGVTMFYQNSSYDKMSIKNWIIWGRIFFNKF